MDKARISDQIAALQRRHVEHILLVHVPFFGVTFDVNDLGFLAGLAFAVLLLMFRYSLATELRALRTALAVAPGSRDVLALSQVLTVPDATGRFWRLLPKALFWLPVLVQFVVLITDVWTFGYGLAIHVVRTWVAVALDLLFLAVSFSLTRQCMKLSGEMDHEWEVTAAGPRLTPN